MRPRDHGYLWDIVTACSDIVAFVRGMSAEEFEANKLVRFAIERQLIVVGEAASHVSLETQAANGHIEWRGIVGLRNILAHDYGEILVERVWNVAKQRIAKLKAAVEEILADVEPAES